MLLRGMRCVAIADIRCFRNARCNTPAVWKNFASSLTHSWKLRSAQLMQGLQAAAGVAEPQQCTALCWQVTLRTRLLVSCHYPRLRTLAIETMLCILHPLGSTASKASALVFHNFMQWARGPLSPPTSFSCHASSYPTDLGTKPRAGCSRPSYEYSRDVSLFRQLITNDQV